MECVEIAKKTTASAAHLKRVHGESLSRLIKFFRREDAKHSFLKASSSAITRSGPRALKPKKKKKKITRVDLWSEKNKRKWQKLRYEAFLMYGRKCALCNSSDKELHVDHIKPKSIYPELCWDINNLQILCRECNLGKGNVFEDDWRVASHT